MIEEDHTGGDATCRSYRLGEAAPVQREVHREGKQKVVPLFPHGRGTLGLSGGKDVLDPNPGKRSNKCVARVTSLLRT